ncbi:MAG: CoA transferase [Dehalococcoidia bacterium]
MSILSDLNVIEISASGAAAMAAKHFADWGASVTILEPAGGTPLRCEPPTYEVGGERRSATWAWLSRGKTAVRVGPGTSLTADDAINACESADVVLVESEMTESVLGMKPREVRARLEGKTTCVLISPFGIEGPYYDYRATDLGVNAMGGWMSLLGDPDREPLRPAAGGGDLTPRITGLYGLVAALISLRHEGRGGEPQFVNLAAQPVVASMTVAPWLVKSMIGFPHERRGNSFPMGVMECADGFVGCPPLTTAHWDLICQLMEMDDVMEQGRDITWRIANHAMLYDRARPWLKRHTRAEILEQGQAFRLPAAPVQTIEDRLACPQLEARGFWKRTNIDGKTVKTPRVTYAVSGLSPVEREAVKETDSVEISKTNASSNGATPAGLPFEGLRVLDLTMLWSGPYAMMLLGALGADVIKVESIQRPDPYRYTWAPVGKDRWFEWAPLWNDSNCNKRDITLDLTSEAGKSLLESLIKDTDIVISNFSNRVMPNLGLTSDRLREINPRLIAVTMPGYGLGGPWEGYVGYAVAFEQLICGSMTGYADGVPSYCGGFCDPMVGLHVITAIDLALRQREATGKGTEVEVTQCETLDSLFAPEQIAVQHGAPVPSRRGNKHEWMAPHDAYRTVGPDQWITIAVASDDEFASMARTLGSPELAADERFASVASRKQNEEALDAVISELVRERDAAVLEQELQEAGVKACRVIKAYDLADDEGLLNFGFFQQIERRFTGTHAFKTWPFRFSTIDSSHKRQPSLLGEHNYEVLTTLLGLNDEEIAHLEETQVIGNEPLGIAG